MRKIFIAILTSFIFSSNISAQTQSWQWVKAGGSTSDNTGVHYDASKSKIGGCDARGNVYAFGIINGVNMAFDTFHSPGAISVNGAGYSSLLYSYDCSGRMRWAKEIGDQDGDCNNIQGIATDPMGNTFVCGQFIFGDIQSNITLFIGDTSIRPHVFCQTYLCVMKFDSLGKLKWINYPGADTVQNLSLSALGGSYGIRLGSSGHLWWQCYLDSNVRFGSVFHSTGIGNYMLEVDPSNGAILGGYRTSNSNQGQAYDFDTQYDIDGNENYYEGGELGSYIPPALGYYPGDTLYLNGGHTYSPDTSLGYFPKPYIFSLDKHGNFRFLIHGNSPIGGLVRTLRYDIRNNRLVSSIIADQSGSVIGRDTIRYNVNNYGVSSQLAVNLPVIYCTDSNGHTLWYKLPTSANTHYGQYFRNVLTGSYLSSVTPDGFVVYDSTDTLSSGTGNCQFNCTDYYRNVMQIDKDGKFKASHSAHLGTINVNSETLTSGATDWRGNLYVGGSITNYMALPNGDTAWNTDAMSGNFFIAKLGTSDCSCPTPGAQFTQVVHGDTVHYYASSINHRDSIHWHFGDGSTSNKDSLTHIYTHGGTYTVTAIAYSGCGIDSITKQVNVTTGISEPVPLETRLYPNPTQTRIFVETSGAARMGMVSANGTSMWEQPVQVNQSGTYVFDMGRFAAALYYFIVEYQNGKVDVIPVVKE